MKTLRVKTIQGQTQPGWQFVSPDGCERYSEGNWQQFVPFANQILGNYDCQQTVS